MTVLCFVCSVFMLLRADEKVVQQVYSSDEAKSAVTDTKRLPKCLIQAESDKLEMMQV
jgi:hypothetical protein